MLRKIERNKKDNTLDFRPIAKENECFEMEENAIFFNTDSDKYCVVKNGLLVEINNNNSQLLLNAFNLIATRIEEQNG